MRAAKAQSEDLSDSSLLHNTCADPESLIREGSNLTTCFLCVFLVDEGREVSNTTIRGSSSAPNETLF